MFDSGQHKRFFSDTLWELDPQAIGGLKGRSVRALQVTTLIFRNFLRNGALLRAAALSFSTLLSFVPLFALAFSVLKGFGVQNWLAPIILRQVAAGSEEVVTRVITYINNTNMASLGAIGLATLLFTALNMLGSVEDAFNSIWGVSKTRSFYRKFSDYLSVLVIAPLLLLAATSIATSLQSKTIVTWLLERTYLGELFLVLLQLTPYLSVSGALFLLYIFMPNTRVRLGSALLGALLAGALWTVAQWGYIHFQFGVGNYNAVYGTLAALPILMVWILVSWLIVLLGMEVTAVHQNLHTFCREMRGDDISQALKEMVALAALRHIAEAFQTGAIPWGEERLSERLRIPLRVMRQTLAQLTNAGFIVPTSTPEDGFHPSRELEQITLEQVIRSLRSHGAACRIKGEDRAEMVLMKVDEAVGAALNGETLKEFVAKNHPPRAVDKGGVVDI